jgi:hypothetical protein
MRLLTRFVAVIVLVLAGGACSDNDDSDRTGSTTSTAPVVSTTTATSPTTTATTATTQPPYGSACAPGSHPDCIDPDGDGRYEYLKNGADCMRTLGDSGLCSDLDSDGVAGYPDSG